MLTISSHLGLWYLLKIALDHSKMLLIAFTTKAIIHQVVARKIQNFGRYVSGNLGTQHYLELEQAACRACLLSNFVSALCLRDHMLYL